MLKSARFLLPYDSFTIRVIVLASLAAAAILGVMTYPPIPQDVTYHNFADHRTISNIPNLNDVISNAFFLIAGILGLYRTRGLASSHLVFRWRFFFASAALVGFGSAYYHLAPTNDTLLGDRLPMTLGFASLTVSLLAERFGERAGRVLFWPMIILSAASVAYWWFTEKMGAGDLRPYILVQFLPLVLSPILLLFFPKGSLWDRPYWILLVGYAIAKGLEWQDVKVFELTHHMVSGHTLKHVAAAMAVLFFSPCMAGDLSSKIFRSKY